MIRGPDLSSVGSKNSSLCSLTFMWLWMWLELSAARSSFCRLTFIQRPPPRRPSSPRAAALTQRWMLARLSDERLLATTLHKACPVIALIVLAALNYFSDKQHSSYCSIETSVVLISSIVSSFDPWQPGVIGWRDFFYFRAGQERFIAFFLAAVSISVFCSGGCPTISAWVVEGQLSYQPT